MISTLDLELYFTKTLEFPEWKSVLDKSKLEFLKKLTQRVGFHNYFHNIIMASVSPENRRTPTLEEVIKLGLEGSGGVCIHQNAFMTFLLREVGFETFLTTGICIGGSSASAEVDTHCMCIVKLTDKEIYLIDVGCALPIDEPIPLHQLPYSGVAAGFRYEYRYCEKTNQYQRWQLDGAFFKGKYDDPKQDILRYKFTLEPKDFSYFQNTSLVDIFTNPPKSIFLRHPVLFRSLDQSLEQLPEKRTGRRFVLVWGASMVTYDNLDRNVKHFSSYEEIKPEILKYFPKVSPSMLETCFGYFENNSEVLVL